MSNHLEGDVWQFLDEHAAHLIRAYFVPNPTTFTGREFDTLGGGGDQSGVANHFTTDDIVAVSLLGVHIPGEAALTLLDHARWASLLLAVDNHRPLWQVDADLVSPESPASVLWNALNEVHDIKWVTANKLCARKRPLLLPVYDTVVKAALQPNRQSFWEPLYNEFADGELQSRLMERVYRSCRCFECSTSPSGCAIRASRA